MTAEIKKESGPDKTVHRTESEFSSKLRTCVTKRPIRHFRKEATDLPTGTVSVSRRKNSTYNARAESGNDLKIVSMLFDCLSRCLLGVTGVVMTMDGGMDRRDTFRVLEFPESKVSACWSTGRQVLSWVAMESIIEKLASVESL